MDCGFLSFSGHALRRMFERGINADVVKTVVQNGKVIAEYIDDKPYPSFLLLGFVDGKPLHVVIAKDEIGQTCIVVTAYPPSSEIWNIDLKTRK